MAESREINLLSAFSTTGVKHDPQKVRLIPLESLGMSKKDENANNIPPQLSQSIAETPSIASTNATAAEVNRAKAKVKRKYKTVGKVAELLQMTKGGGRAKNSSKNKSKTKRKSKTKSKPSKSGKKVKNGGKKSKRTKKTVKKSKNKSYKKKVKSRRK